MGQDGEEPPDDPGETADLFSVLVEVAALRSEVRTESRLVKEALEQFRGVFDTLQASQATLQRELDRARTEKRDQAQSALRPLPLDVIDLRDRLVAAPTLSAAAARPRWRDRGGAHAVRGGGTPSLARPPVAPGPVGCGSLAGRVAHDIAEARTDTAGSARGCHP